jgi:multidrug efflux system membrane fusion protein
MPTSRLTAFAGKHRPLLIAALVLVLVFAGIFLWRSARQAAGAHAYAPPPTEVSAIQVRAETLPQSLRATGALQAVQQVMLASEAPGRVTAIRFQAGQQAGAGAVLVQLFDAPERADRAAAVARLQFADLQYNRSRQLAPTGAEPRQLLQQREAELAQAKAALQQIDAKIAQKTIRAPFSGQLGLRRVNLGQYVNAGDPVVTLTALDSLYVNFTIPQQQLAQIRVGGEVVVSTDAAPGRTFTARVNAVEPVVGGDTRNVSVQAIKPNPGQALRPGLYVTVALVQPPRAGAILVPTTAIQTSASGDTVFLVKGGKAVPALIKAGAEVGDRTVIESGVRAGDVVVTTGQVRLQPGGAVKIAASGAPATAPAR